MVVARSRRGSVVIMRVGLGGLLLLHFLFSGAFLLEVGLPSRGLLELLLEEIVPLLARRSHLLKRLIVFVKEEFGKLRQIPTIFKLSGSHLAGVLKIPIFV